MPEKFLDAAARAHATKPFSSKRATALENLNLGVGVHLGFTVAVTSPVSKKVLVRRGLAVGPDGAEIRVATDPKLSAADYRKAVNADEFAFDVEANLESLSETYATLNPASHALLITLDVKNHKLRALSITTAEKTAIDAAITASENSDAAATGEFEEATVDHRARLRGSYKDPDTFAAATVAEEYVLATATLAATGGNINAVTSRRERKQLWATMTQP